MNARGVVFVHSSPTAVCPHVEWAISGVLGTKVSLQWTPQPAVHGQLRAECTLDRPGRQRRRARRRPAGLVDAALRGHRGADARGRRRALLPRAHARPVARPDQRQRRRRDRRGPAARAARRGARRPSSRPGCTSCSARRGTRPWSRSAAPATAPRSPGCTRSADRSAAVRGRRCRHPLSRARPLCASGGRRSGAGEGDRGVVPAEAERVADRGVQVHLARLAGHDVELDARVEVLQVERGRDDRPP